MVGQHHQVSGLEFEQILGDSEGQGSLVCCSPWGCRKSDITVEAWSLNHWTASEVPKYCLILCPHFVVLEMNVAGFGNCYF